MKKLIFALFLTIALSTQAAINPSSFEGEFLLAECDYGMARSARISFINNALVVRYNNFSLRTQIFELNDRFNGPFETYATQEDFAVTNVNIFNDGAIEKLEKRRIEISRTGERVQINTLNYKTNHQTECIFFRR